MKPVDKKFFEKNWTVTVDKSVSHCGKRRGCLFCWDVIQLHDEAWIYWIKVKVKILLERWHKSRKSDSFWKCSSHGLIWCEVILIFIDVYMFGLKLFTGLLVDHQWWYMMWWSSWTIFCCLPCSCFYMFIVHRMTPRLVHIFTWWRCCLLCSISGNYVHMMLSGLVSHDGLWSRVEPVCDVWHLIKCAVGDKCLTLAMPQVLWVSFSIW